MNLDFTKSVHWLVRANRVADIAGVALCRKVWAQVDVSGTYQAAKNLRKQGYPLRVALALVAGRVT